MKEANCPHSNPVHHQYPQAPLVVQGVAHLNQFDKDLVEDLLPHFRKIFNHIDFEGGGTCDPT